MNTLNQLLTSLPPEDFARVSAALAPRALKARQTLQRRGEPLSAVFFPGHSLTSLTLTMSDGATAEAIVVGAEGLVGIEAALGAPNAMCDATVQVAGDAVAHVMGIDAFRQEFDRRGAFHANVMTYAQDWTRFLLQSVTCNALHAVENRCCRWLLHANDRLASHAFPLTHDLLSTMLGVRRPTVTLVMADLVRQGIVRTSRGMIDIVDRDALEALSCECYRVVRDIFNGAPDISRSRASDAAVPWHAAS